MEGAEEQVLATVDPARFKLIMFEANLLSPAARARINATLMQAGHAHIAHLTPWASMVYARVDASAVAQLTSGSCRTSVHSNVPDCSAFKRRGRGDFMGHETSRAELWEALKATLPRHTHSA